MDDANLNFIQLREARLNGALMHDASLIGADLQGAWFEAAAVENVNLAGANLDGAHFDRALLDGPNLHWASLVGADLSTAHLDGTCLMYADLRGADLTRAEHLTTELLQQAFGDNNTKLPESHRPGPDLRRPDSRSKPIEEQRKGKEPFSVSISSPGNTQSPCDS